MIKSIHCEEEAINRSRRSKTAQNQFKVESKIKNLIVQDKVKHKKTQLPGYDFDKYEYSDDESMNEHNEPYESKIESEASRQYEYSSFQEPKKKKEEFDVVSNSSSFSKFSLGSQR